MCAVTQAFKKNHCGNRGESALGSAERLPLSRVQKDERAFLGCRKKGEALRVEDSMCQGT